MSEAVIVLAAGHLCWSWVIVGKLTLQPDSFFELASDQAVLISVSLPVNLHLEFPVGPTLHTKTVLAAFYFFKILPFAFEAKDAYGLQGLQRRFLSISSCLPEKWEPKLLSIFLYIFSDLVTIYWNFCIKCLTYISCKGHKLLL